MMKNMITDITLPQEGNNNIKDHFELLIESDLDVEKAAELLLQTYKKQLQERKVMRNKKKKQHQSGEEHVKKDES